MISSIDQMCTLITNKSSGFLLLYYQHILSFSFAYYAVSWAYIVSLSMIVLEQFNSKYCWSVYVEILIYSVVMNLKYKAQRTVKFLVKMMQ